MTEDEDPGRCRSGYRFGAYATRCRRFAGHVESDLVDCFHRGNNYRGNGTLPTLMWRKGSFETDRDDEYAWRVEEKGAMPSPRLFFRKKQVEDIKPPQEEKE